MGKDYRKDEKRWKEKSQMSTERLEKGRLSKKEIEKYSISQIRESDFLEIGPLFLYMPRSHKAKTMLVGDPESQVALCTGWNDPEFVVFEESINEFSIVAPLRSLTGIDIMLYNLAANPWIRYVGFWAGGSQDETERAKKPRETLEALWQNGIEEDGTIRGTGYKLNKSLIENGAIEVIRKITQNVTLVDWRQNEKRELGKLASFLPKATSHMDRIRFPELLIEEVESFPSEEISIFVREKKAADAWFHLLDRIMRYGKNTILETEQGTKIREVQFAHVVIESESGDFYFPDWLGKIPELSLTPQSLEDYYRRYFTPEPYLIEIYPGVKKFIRPEEDKYLYCELLYAFPRPKEIDLAVAHILSMEGIGGVKKFLEENFPLQNPEKREIVERIWYDFNLSPEKKSEILLEIFRPPINQVENVIKRIKEIPDDADKTFVLWDPATHGIQYSGRPCLVEMGLLIRNGKINSRAVFRSHDIPRGWLKNFYGIYRFLQKIGQETGYPIGEIEINSESAHLYLSDQEWVKKLWQERIVKATPKRVFDETKADPRGNFAIELVDGEIVCTLLSPKEGTPLIEIKGRTANSVIAQLGHLDLISQVSHGLDIGAELTKAEICLREGILYVQDKPLGLKKDRI